MRTAAAAVVLVAVLAARGILIAGPSAGLRLEVPFVPQVEQGCGSAAIAMVLLWWQQHGFTPKTGSVDTQTIHRELYRETENGARASDLSRYLEQHGFQSISFSGEWADLTEHLEKGRPLIAAIRPPGQRQLHFVVVSGLSTDLVLLHDPAKGAYRALARKNFEKQWDASQRFTLLALPSP